MLDVLLGATLFTGLILWVLGIVVIGAVTLCNDRREMRRLMAKDEDYRVTEDGSPPLGGG